LKADPEGPTLISHVAFYTASQSMLNFLSVCLRHTFHGPLDTLPLATYPVCKKPESGVKPTHPKPLKQPLLLAALRRDSLA
jgi:hypothetical protein